MSLNNFTCARAAKSTLWPEADWLEALLKGIAREGQAAQVNLKQGHVNFRPLKASYRRDLLYLVDLGMRAEINLASLEQARAWERVRERVQWEQVREGRYR